jgi:glutaconate CoA-transferase, subunit A
MTPLPSLLTGEGPLLTDPDPDHARAFFAEKARARTDKLTTPTEAVRRLIHDGDYIAIGGFGTNRIPTAILHEILRQGRQNLRFSGHTSTHDFQLICAGNLTGRGKALAAVDAAYIVGLEARGLSPHGRRVMQSGEVVCTEWSNYTLALRYRAAAMGVPFLPARSILGTDTFRHSGAREIECPFTGKKLAAIPALYPDVGVIHVHEADRYGNARIRGTSVADLDLGRAAKRLIVTCERLIPSEEITRDPTATAIPFFCVDAVCEVPFGSYPGNMPYEYHADEAHLCQWLEAEEEPERYREFLTKYLYNVEHFEEYLALCGGLGRLQQLRQQELLLDRGR